MCAAATWVVLLAGLVPRSSISFVSSPVWTRIGPDFPLPARSDSDEVIRIDGTIERIACLVGILQVVPLVLRLLSFLHNNTGDQFGPGLQHRGSIIFLGIQIGLCLGELLIAAFVLHKVDETVWIVQESERLLKVLGIFLSSSQQEESTEGDDFVDSSSSQDL